MALPLCLCLCLCLWITCAFFVFPPHLSAEQAVVGGFHFFSVFCGAEGGGSANLTDPSLPGLIWEADTNFIGTGVGGRVADTTAVAGQYQSVRFFPKNASPTKNCYVLRTVVGSVHLVRAGFLYGNYDGLQSPTVQFQLVLDSTAWVDVSIPGDNGSIVFYEAFTAPAVGATLSVCLVRTGNDTPFINSLELREVGASSYTARLRGQRRILQLWSRVNFGERKAKSAIRYPDDPLDRIWLTDVDAFPGLVLGTPIAAPAGQIIDNSNTDDLVPSAVARTALTGPSISYTRSLPPGSHELYQFVFFAELNASLGALGSSRTMDISWTANNYFDSFTKVLNDSAFTVTGRGYNSLPVNTDFLTIDLKRDASSSLDVIVNADELYFVLDEINGTNADDVQALAHVKNVFNLVEWVGDPCLPVPWDEIECAPGSGADGTRVTSLDLSGKNLSGIIPVSQLIGLTSLAKLILKNNSFSNVIPTALGRIKPLTYLDVSNNQLSGSLYAWMESLTYLDVSNNQLDGSYPSSLLSLLGSQFRYSGNPRLQCAPASSTDVCPLSSPPPAASPLASANSSSHSSPTPLIVGVSIAGFLVFVALVAALCLVFFTKCCRRVPPNPSPTPGSALDDGRLPPSSNSISIDDIKAATNNYAQKVGNGATGDVYYGVLTKNRKQEVAVKRVSGGAQGSSFFFNEVAILSNTNHRNLVSLVGFCHSPPELILVYEFMPGGDLRQRLYGDKSSPPLNWEQRVNIAWDAAKGLQYLHEGCNIIHRDLKSSNILLSSSLEAKLGDFGISKHSPEDRTHVTTRVIGTPGYLDPEYHSTGLLTQKSDVYSFGMVLLEILCGQPPFSSSIDDGFIVTRVQNAMKTANMAGVVDQKLNGWFPPESAWRLAEIAFKCMETKSSARPKIGWVVNQLSHIMPTTQQGKGPSFLHHTASSLPSFRTRTEMRSSARPSPR